VNHSSFKWDIRALMGFKISYKAVTKFLPIHLHLKFYFILILNHRLIMFKSHHGDWLIRQFSHTKLKFHRHYDHHDAIM